MELRQTSKSLKSLDIRNSEEQKLYIDVEGTRRENLNKLNEIASLYEFLNDFKFID